MKLTLALIGVALTLSADLAHADLINDLKDLKKICDAGLLSEKVCIDRQAKILAKYDHPADEWFCNYGGETDGPAEFSTTDGKSFSETASASEIAKEILDSAGLAPNFVVRPASVPNAAASARGGMRFIEYNPAFISQLKSGSKTNWAVYSVLAHEIGHHLQGHTLQGTGSRPPIELEADRYSGFILAKLGSSLEEAQIAMRTFGSNSASGTHPPTNDRLQAIAKGWQDAKALAAKSSKTKPDEAAAEKKPSSHIEVVVPPQPVAFSDSCIISGEALVITAANGAVLSRIRGFMQVGQKLPPAHPSCLFDIQSGPGRYCIGPNGMVFAGTPIPVGQCKPCLNNACQ